MIFSFRRLDVILLLLQLVMTGVSVIVIDRVGRRPLLLCGVSGMVFLCLLLLIVCSNKFRLHESEAKRSKNVLVCNR